MTIWYWGLTVRISHMPRPWVPAARMLRLGTKSSSTTCTFGRPVPKRVQVVPTLVAHVDAVVGADVDESLPSRADGRSNRRARRAGCR